MTGPWIIAFLGLCALVALLTVVLLGLMRRVAILLESLQPPPDLRDILPVGSKVPAFEVRDEIGGLIGSDDLIREPTVLLMLSSGCSPCRRLAAELEAAHPELPVPTIALVDGDDDVTTFGRLGFPVHRSATAFQAFRSSATPVGFALDRDRVVVARGVVNSADRLTELAQALAPGLQPRKQAAFPSAAENS